MDTHVKRGLACLIALSCAWGIGMPARGQVAALPPRTDVAGARIQRGFEPIDIRLGPWVVAPELNTRVGLDTNIYGLDSNVIADGFIAATPGLGLRSDWGRHNVALDARGTLTRYIAHPEQNTQEYSLSGQAVLDLADMRVTLDAGWDSTAERRGLNGVPLTRGEPSTYAAATQTMDVRRDIGTIAFDLRLRHRDVSFSDITRLDGTIASQQFRDADSWSVTVSSGFSPTPTTVVGASVDIDFRDAPFDPNRSGMSVAARGQVGADIGMMRFDLAAGYLNHRYDRQVFKDFQGFVFEANASWFPTPLLTVTASAARQVQGSGDPAAGAIVVSSLGLKIDYELLRNLLIQGSFNKRIQRFTEIDRKRTAHSVELKGEFSFNRTVAIGAYARHECEDSSGTAAGRDYCASLIGLTMRLRR